MRPIDYMARNERLRPVTSRVLVPVLRAGDTQWDCHVGAKTVRGECDC